MAGTIKTIEKYKIFDVGYSDDREKTQQKINKLLNDGWKIKSQLLLDNGYNLSVVFEKEVI